jgi:hypothetical protein
MWLKHQPFNCHIVYFGMVKSCVTFSLFRFDTIATRWWAFTQMGFGVKNLLSEVKGLRFCKLLGSGGGNGFSVFPNFGAYSLMCVWESEEDSHVFFEQHPFFQAYKNKSCERWSAWLHTAMAHGVWDGESPFPVTEEPNNHQLVAVLTRATIKPKFLLQFWKFVPRTSASVIDKEGRIFSIGIGEVPIIQQATFSLWQNAQLMMDYAYKSKFHSEVVRKTRELGWYSEELFARFFPYKEEGTWGGKKMLEG